MCANGSSRAPTLLRGRPPPLATARTRPCSRVSKVTIRSASPSLCWRSTTARSRYSRIRPVWHRNLIKPARSAVGVSEPQPAQLFGVALPVLRDLDPQVQIHLGAKQLLDLG